MNRIEKLIKLFCDNKSAVLNSNNSKSSTKSKHIDIKFLVLKERVQNGQMSIEHIGTNFMIVDPITKGLPPKAFRKHTAHMGIVLLKIYHFSESLYFRCFSVIDTFYGYSMDNYDISAEINSMFSFHSEYIDLISLKNKVGHVKIG